MHEISVADFASRDRLVRGNRSAVKDNESWREGASLLTVNLLPETEAVSVSAHFVAFKMVGRVR